MKPSEKLIQHERVRPQLFINTEILSNKKLESSLFEEIDKYSITPTAFKARSLNDDLIWYKDEYSHSTNKVTRYGINANITKADFETNKILGELTNLIDTTKKVEKSVKSSQYKLEDAQKITHHGLEKYLVQQAINQLLGSKDQTILVDIFARENGAIKILKDSIPETHTVVFYKNPVDMSAKHEVLVIDPSNFLFSSHLSNLNEILKHELLSKVTTMHKTLQIYKPANDYIGSNPDQYRDCIDIAVKIAFGLNEIKNQIINLDNFKDHHVVKTISNNPAIDKSIINKDLIAKIKQTSDTKVVKTFYAIEQTISKNLDIISSSYEDMYSKFKKNYTEILCSNKSNTSILENLLFCNETYIKTLANELNHEQQELIGTFKEITEL